MTTPLADAGADTGASTSSSSGASGEGGPVCTAEQVAGDCQKVVCNADGTKSTDPDDSDAPATAVACSVAKCSGGKVVTEPLPNGTNCEAGRCDKGTCVQKLGQACSNASECPSGFCVDGVCCNEACDGECKACDNTEAKGICSDIGYYKEDLKYRDEGADRVCTLAVGGSVCDGKGKCLKVAGTVCNLDPQCVSGDCSPELKCLGAKGEACSGHADCVSNKCAMGACD